MSNASKAFLGGSFAVTIATIGYVHFSQQSEREKLREGVLIDIERQRQKKQNIDDLNAQIELTKELKRIEAESSQ